jgi:hypothetical protein
LLHQLREPQDATQWFVEFMSHTRRELVDCRQAVGMPQLRLQRADW